MALSPGRHQSTGCATSSSVCSSHAVKCAVPSRSQYPSGPMIHRPNCLFDEELCGAVRLSVEVHLRCLCDGAILRYIDLDMAEWSHWHFRSCYSLVQISMASMAASLHLLEEAVSDLHVTRYTQGARYKMMFTPHLKHPLLVSALSMLGYYMLLTVPDEVCEVVALF